MQFLGHAFGSLLELETQAHIASDLGYVDVRLADDCLNKTSELSRIINGLSASLKVDKLPQKT